MKGFYAAILSSIIAGAAAARPEYYSNNQGNGDSSVSLPSSSSYSPSLSSMRGYYTSSAGLTSATRTTLVTTTKPTTTSCTSTKPSAPVSTSIRTRPVPTGSYAGTSYVTVTLRRDGKLQFNPPYLSDKRRGHIVRFRFRDTNFTITESSLETPCSKRNVSAAEIRPPSRGRPFTTFVLGTDQNTPRWFFCNQELPNTFLTKCSGETVFAINPKDRSQFELFQKNAGSPQATKPVTTTPARPTGYWPMISTTRTGATESSLTTRITSTIQTTSTTSAGLTTQTTATTQTGQTSQTTRTTDATPTISSMLPTLSTQTTNATPTTQSTQTSSTTRPTLSTSLTTSAYFPGYAYNPSSPATQSPTPTPAAY